MSKTKFTPAPWKQNGINAVHTKNGTCVAITHNGENRKADATLIAAAPAMYAELQSIHKQLTEIAEHLHPNIAGVDKMCEEIKSILAAARGEANQPQP